MRVLLLPGWDSPAALYHNFDTLTGLGLMAISGISNYDALVPGKVKLYVRLEKVNPCVRSGRDTSVCLSRWMYIDVFDNYSALSTELFLF